MQKKIAIYFDSYLLVFCWFLNFWNNLNDKSFIVVFNNFVSVYAIESTTSNDNFCVTISKI